MTIALNDTTASLSASDLRQLFEWNRTEVPFDSSKCVHDLFDEQVARSPEKTAVICRDQTLTYAVLHRRAEQLARRLRELGVGTETVVAVSMERSTDMVVALIGILKAGGAYLPLDPAFPAERVAFMLKDSSARVILTNGSPKDRFAESGAVVVSLDESDLDDAIAPPEALAGNSISSSLAYLMYTSGSTGTPKGVMVEHRNVVNFFAGMDSVVGTEAGVWLAVTSISFDISVLELLWTLTRGFTVVLQTGKNGLAATGDYSIAAQIARHGVTHFQCTPTLARSLTRFPETLSAMKLLKKLFLGGEALALPLANQLKEELSAEIFNMYGPTETTVWSTTCRVEKADRPVPIGRPIANTSIYIVDEQGMLAPIGTAGELYIGGAGVTRGYWRRPDLTAEKFVANSFEPERPEMLYKTGDLVRYLENGEIEFIGRTDQQVKIRGFRIELGEIEAILGTHPAVHEVAAVVRRDQADNPQLAAYVVAKPGLSITASELKTHVRRKLPEYMVPAVITLLDAMPLTPNGKTDRKSLPAPIFNSIGQSADNGHTSTDLEATIVELWKDALGLDSVGLQVNIFDLGANSLSVAEVATSLRQKLKREIPLTDFFAYPTIAALASHLGKGAGLNGHGANHRGRGLARREALLARAQARTHASQDPAE